MDRYEVIQIVTLLSIWAIFVTVLVLPAVLR